MATLRDKLKDLPNLKEFEGGNDKQRMHLNELVKAINDIRTAAKQDKDADHALLKGMTRTNFDAWLDGTLATYAQPAQLVA